jgi:hypothetical protein
VSLRNFLLVLTLIFLSQSVFAENMDYSLCFEYFEKARKNSAITGFNIPFAVNEKGQIAFEDPRVNKQDLDDEMREYTWVTQAPNITRHRLTVTLSDEQVVQMDYSQNNKFDQWTRDNTPVLLEDMESVVGFESVDGKCFPSYGGVENSFSDKRMDPNGPQERSLTSTLFDSQLCYDIKKFFDKNPKVQSCFSGNSKEDKEMKTLFKENGFEMDQVVKDNYEFARDYYQASAPYNYSVEQRMILANPKVAPQIMSFNAKENKTLFKLLGDTPLLSAHRILMDCYDKGLGKTISAKNIFGDLVTPNSDTSGEATETSDAKDSE